MSNFLENSVFFGVFISIITYEIGVLIKKKLKLAIFNPLLISIALIIVFLLAFHIKYNVYESGAQCLSYFLTPATVALAVPLYEQIEPLKKNWKAIVAGILSGALTSALCVLAVALIFQLDHKQYVTLLPKSITTAIGMGLSEELGGIVTITVAVIVVTGVIGNMFAESICKLFHITDPVRFEKSLKVTIEHGHANHLSDDWSSTAYWYQTLPTSKNITILPMEERLPNVPVLPERDLRMPELTDEMKAARDSWEKRWEEYSPARQEQFRIKEEKARRESRLNTEFAKKLRDEYK